jgi:hypothetical protein
MLEGNLEVLPHVGTHPCVIFQNLFGAWMLVDVRRVDLKLVAH